MKFVDDDDDDSNYDVYKSVCDLQIVKSQVPL